MTDQTETRGDLFPTDGGWLCDPCNVYFGEDRDACPHCGARVDHAVGVAR